MLVKQTLSMYLGLLIVFVHIFMSIYFWIEFSNNSSIHVGELSTPISAALTVSIVKWFVDNQGIVRSEDRVYIGVPYFALILIIVVSLLSVYIGGVIYYKMNQAMSAAELNQFYLYSETSIGGLFAIIYSDLYDKPRNVQ